MKDSAELARSDTLLEMKRGFETPQREENSSEDPGQVLWLLHPKFPHTRIFCCSSKQHVNTAQQSRAAFCYVCIGIQFLGGRR